MSAAVALRAGWDLRVLIPPIISSAIVIAMVPYTISGRRPNLSISGQEQMLPNN